MCCYSFIGERQHQDSSGLPRRTGNSVFGVQGVKIVSLSVLMPRFECASSGGSAVQSYYWSEDPCNWSDHGTGMVYLSVVM